MLFIKLSRVLLLSSLLSIAPSAFASGKAAPRIKSSAAQAAKQNAVSSKSEITVRLANTSTLVSYDSRMLEAAEIAKKSANSRSIRRCWRFVKRALVAADLVDTYPGTVYAKQAGSELASQHGFTKIPVTDPFAAPVGSVLVYGGKGPGHVEIRTKEGFVSDFASAKPSPRPLIGVYVKPRREG